MYGLPIIALFSTCVLSIGCTTPTTSSTEENSRQLDKYATELVKNDKIREVYIKCLLEKGPCNEDAADVKKMVPEAVQRGCAKCSEMHKKIIEKMMLHLQEKQPEILKQVSAKFDPKGEFMKTFLSKLKPITNDKSAKPADNGQKSGKSPQAASQPEQSTQASQTQQPKPIKN